MVRGAYPSFATIFAIAKIPQDDMSGYAPSRTITQIYFSIAFTIFAKVSGSWMASSERVLRSSVTPFLRS